MLTLRRETRHSFTPPSSIDHTPSSQPPASPPACQRAPSLRHILPRAPFTRAPAHLSLLALLCAAAPPRLESSNGGAVPCGTVRGRGFRAVHVPLRPPALPPGAGMLPLLLPLFPALCVQAAFASGCTHAMSSNLKANRSIIDLTQAQRDTTRAEREPGRGCCCWSRRPAEFSEGSFERCALGSISRVL